MQRDLLGKKIIIGTTVVNIVSLFFFFSVLFLKPVFVDPALPLTVCEYTSTGSHVHRANIRKPQGYTGAAAMHSRLPWVQLQPTLLFPISRQGLTVSAGSPAQTESGFERGRQAGASVFSGVHGSPEQPACLPACLTCRHRPGGAH